MLISPPFLPSREGNQSDADWLNLAMNSVSSNFIPELGNETIAGAYPVSMELGWHGGTHLIAPPGEEATTLPVRAIADGTVIYARQPTAQNRNDDEPLNYGAPAGSSCWTSDGTVLIRHETDIGASPDGQAISVVFYSLYMHLDSIAEGVARNRRIYRKEELGSAGYIYGQPHRIHFEIFCDDENLQRLTGRQSGELPLGADGRSSVVFGEMYFYLPAGSHLYSKQPLANLTTPTEAPIYTTEEDLFVGLRHAEGDGVIGQRGDSTVTTYHGDGTPEGEPLIERDAEYKIYAKAKAIAEAYPTTGRPAPSAVYELLRFGRVINTANETLSPPDVPHWRQVKYPDGQGWANLNATNVRKFSDADFPHWKGWRFIEDSADKDSRRDSPTIRRWFNTNQDAWVDIAEAREGLRNQALLHRLEHTICKFPSEWRADTIDQRWAWLMNPENENFEALSDDDFNDFKAHAQALCFWEQVPTQTPALPDNPWRFHPRWFIQTFRRCRWFSEREQQATISLATDAGKRRAASLRVPMNTTMQKYLGTASSLRASHFLAQVGHETGWWLYREELGNERYFRTMYEEITSQEATDDYRSGLASRLGLVRPGETEHQYGARRPAIVAKKASGMDNGAASTATGGLEGDGSRFRGRGFLQITGRRNYKSYGLFRGQDFLTDPNPRLLASNTYNACDASGFFWSRERANKEADGGAFANHITRVGGIVNRGSAGKLPLHNPERHRAFSAIWSALNDEA